MLSPRTALKLKKFTRTILTHAIAKNIPQHQQFVESLATLSEPIRIPSSVVTLAVIRSLVLMGLENCSINWRKVVALITVHFQLPVMNVNGLAYLA